MSDYVLVINSGSSSLKYQVVDATSGDALATGLIERIGSDDGVLTHTYEGTRTIWDVSADDHVRAIEHMQHAFTALGPALADIDLVAVGHRVVQGGARFGGPVLITADVEHTIDELSDLAPLHNPANLAGITAAREIFDQLPHIAVFDTAFHLTMPNRAATYALNAQVARQYRLRRYGAHGTSHAYVSRQAAHYLQQDPAATNVIVLHLGNGASITAVAGGESVDTSMGLTPLEGLVMGTRTGDIDPSVVMYLNRHAGMGIDEIDDLLNRRSGMLGLTGHQDMRDVVAAIDAGDDAADAALDLYCYRLQKFIGAYTAILPRVDAVVFTAGIGENAAEVRYRTMARLEHLGMGIDEHSNGHTAGGLADLTPSGARVRTLMIPTNEEWEIATQAVAVIAVEGTAATNP